MKLLKFLASDTFSIVTCMTTSMVNCAALNRGKLQDWELCISFLIVFWLGATLQWSKNRK